ncbi:MAG: coproporphyrinogen dehydrogenase HemZ [Oscillospiraceae bacterium]|nr:coproporphyrinogen dehydrogenase HemZ [Oscillospiraceae bacterium]MCL2227767.1 coproporphyrinogen dehydrogenase HemZ [Oscillospiraceae bacterium]
MKLRLVGHEYKYAVEQIMLSLFPGEKPEYLSDADASIDSADLSAESRLTFSETTALSASAIRYRGKVFRGAARVSRKKLANKLVADRLLQRIVKQSFFRAAKGLLGVPPVWGSLTGIRPAHIASSAMEAGRSAGSAKRMLTGEYYVSPERAEMCIQAAQASLALKQELLPSDIALYIGIPFCPTRCAYCSFVSNSVEKSFGMIAPFVELLLREIEMAAAMVRGAGLRITSIYVGGGTPTALPEPELSAVMSALQASFDLAGVREFTFEAGRPDTITEGKLDIITRYGVRRICVNPQSMSDDVLNAIGRKHSASDVLNAVRMVRQSGAALNMDAIAGLPADTPMGFQNTIDSILALNPENVTIHTLSLKKGAKIMLEGTEVPAGEDVGAMLDYAFRQLSSGGWRPYYLYRQKFTTGGFENTGWCLPGHEGVYNICMMEELCTVLALGGGGVTKLVSPEGRIERIFNAKYPREYLLYADKLSEKYDKIKKFVSGEPSPTHKQEE